jgi:hypothetical protein
MGKAWTTLFALFHRVISKPLQNTLASLVEAYLTSAASCQISRACGRASNVAAARRWILRGAWIEKESGSGEKLWPCVMDEGIGASRPSRRFK